MVCLLRVRGGMRAAGARLGRAGCDVCGVCLGFRVTCDNFVPCFGQLPRPGCVRASRWRLV